MIVGVGDADFSQMHQLDGDEALLSHNRKTASRDIVQFVSYNDVMQQGPSSLAAAVLEEVQQLLVDSPLL